MSYIEFCDDCSKGPNVVAIKLTTWPVLSTVETNRYIDMHALQNGVT